MAGAEAAEAEGTVVNDPVFTTDRLRVFLLQCIPSDGVYCEKDVFVAFRTDDEVAYPVCTATLDLPAGEYANRHYVEWIETNEGHRRNGIARELLKGIERYYGDCDIQMDGATDAGDAFVDAWYGE